MISTEESEGGVLSISTSVLVVSLALPSLTLAVHVTVSPGERVVVARSSVSPVPRFWLWLVHV